MTNTTINEELAELREYSSMLDGTHERFYVSNYITHTRGSGADGGTRGHKWYALDRSKSNMNITGAWRKSARDAYADLRETDEYKDWEEMK